MTEQSETAETLNRAFWGLLMTERTVMLSLAASEALARPMTAMVEPEPEEEPRMSPTVWFYAPRSSRIMAAMQGLGAKGAPASFTFVAQEHQLFATVRGLLSVSDDQAMIDRFGEPEPAPWFAGPEEPPALLRFDPSEAEIWDAAVSLVDGMKLLLGQPAEETLASKVAKIAY